MLIYMFATLCLVFFSIIELSTKIKKKTFYILFSIVCLLLILIAGLRYGLETDYWHYYNIYNGIEKVNSLELGFDFLICTTKFFGANFYVFVFLLAVSSVGLKIISFKDLKYPFLAILLYFLRFYVLFELNAIRQGIAIAFVMWGVYCYIEKEDNKKFILFSIIASLFHASSILILLIYPFGKKKISFPILILMFVFVTVLRFLFLDRLVMLGASLVPSILASSNNLLHGAQYIFNSADKNLAPSFASLFRILISYFAYRWLVIHGGKRKEKANSFLNVYLIGSLINIAFMGYNTIGYRLASVFFCIEGFLISYALEGHKLFRSKKTSIPCLICLLIVISCDVFSFCTTIIGSETLIPYKCVFFK